MNYTIAGTLKGFEQVHKQGHRIIRFTKLTENRIRSRITAHKIEAQRKQVVEPIIPTPLNNPTPVVNVAVSELNNLSSDLNLLRAKLTKLGIELKAKIYRENPTLQNRKALKVKINTRNGLYRIKKATPKMEEKVIPTSFNNNSISKPELPNLENSNTNVEKVEFSQPKAIDITSFQPEASNKQPYGGAQIYSAINPVTPSIDKEIRIPNSVPIASEKVQTSDDINQLKELIRKLNEQATSLDKDLITAKLEYDREQAEAQLREINYLKAQASLLRQTISSTQSDLLRTKEETARLKASSDDEELGNIRRAA